MNEHTPIIKGMFVNSHVKALRRAKGDAAVKKLERMFGKSVEFRTMQYVPVRDEVRILELSLSLLHPEVPEERRIVEAGKLHFRNFSKTPYGRLMFNTLPRDFKMLLLNAKYIAQHVFQHVQFTAIDQGKGALQIIMENNDYPLAHFEGFFLEWMKFFGLKNPEVSAHAPAPKTFVYKMVWQEDEHARKKGNAAR